MIEKNIPSTGEKLPVIGLGTWQSFDKTSSADLDQLTEVVNGWANSGGRLIDSSPMYGKSERMIGNISQKANLGDDLFYATKVWTNGKNEGIKQMEESFQKMNRTTIDLMQIHNLQDWKTHLPILREWKSDKKIRYIGITHYTDASHDELVRLIRSEKLDFVQFNYSLLNRNAEKSLLATAQEYGVATIINRPFGEGSLLRKVSSLPLPNWAGELDCNSWADFILKYIISHPAVTCVIPATSSLQHILENAKAGTGILPDQSMRQRMVEYIKNI